MDKTLVEIAKVIVANGVEDWCLSPTQLFVTMKNDDIQDRTFGELNEKNLIADVQLDLRNGRNELVFGGHKVALGLLADEIDRQWEG